MFRLRENVPCALYALDVSDEAYTRARRRAEHMMAHGSLYQFNVIGLALCGMHIRWKRRRHYFCSQFVSEVLEKSGAMELPKHSTLMHPNDYTRLEELRCVYKGTLAGLPQRQQMEFDQNDTVIGVYLGLALGLFHTGAAQVRKIFLKKFEFFVLTKQACYAKNSQVGERTPDAKWTYGPLVKRLRQRPLTPLTSVRFRYGSPFYSSKTVMCRFI